jgi:DNA-binding NarL/FixJ family response regulator
LGNSYGVQKRVLVVDDEPHIRDLVAIWLDDDPRCDVVLQAGDLDVAVQLADHEHPDVILLDFEVGHRRSTEALPALRRSCPDALIVVHTAAADEAARANVEGHGANRIIEKASMSVADVIELALS